MLDHNRLSRHLGAVALTAALIPALVACGSDDPDAADGDARSAETSDSGDGAEQASAVSMTDPWIKATDASMTAAFGVLVNDSDADVTLVAASVDGADMVELHETVQNDDGAMAMQAKEGGFVIPAGGEHVRREEPAAFAGGTFLVVRRIRMDLEGWDRLDRNGREEVIGRRLDTGAPLTGEAEFDEPDFEETTSFGFPVIDPASHVARARSENPDQRFLRRAYNYVVPDADSVTGEDAGLVFLAYAADVAEQFVPVQQRLAETDRLNEWVTAIGSAVYAVPPAATEDGYVGQSLLEPGTTQQDQE